MSVAALGPVSALCCAPWLGCEVAASVSVPRLHPAQPSHGGSPELLQQRCHPLGRQLDLQTNAPWKAKKWLHLIFVPQDHIKELIDHSL